MLLFCTAHGLAAIAWAIRRRGLTRTSKGAGVPRWAVWAWVVATQVGNFGAVRIIERERIGLPIAAVALAGICGLAVGNGFWTSEPPTASHHVVRVSIALGLVALAAFSL